MVLGPAPSAMHIAKTLSGAQTSPSYVTIHPSALFTILDHYLRRKDAQERVIGTLLGVRTDENGGTVEVRTAFAVLHSETDEQVAVDMEYHQTLFELHRKVNPKEVIVGWYSTGSNLNTYSALIQNFYTQETTPHPAIHVALNTGLDNSEPGVKAYISSPVGVNPRPENCIFLPIPCDLRFHVAERSGLELLLQTEQIVSPQTDLQLLAQSISMVQSMLDRVLVYVRSVLSGEIKGDPAVGRYLMDALGAGTDEIEKAGFTASLQDTLMMTYLANLVRSQVEVSSRLALTGSSLPSS